MRSTSVALALASILLVPSRQAEAARGARLTYVGDPATSIVVGWNSNDAADTTISYGTSPNALSKSAQGTKIQQDAALGFSFNARLTGLTPGTTYFYRIGNYPAAPAAPFQFTTRSADPCDPFTFVVLGDNRADLDGIGPNDLWKDIIAESMVHDPDFFLNTGDMVKNGEDGKEWSNFINISEKQWALVPNLLTLGNHDDDEVHGENAKYNQLFELPRNTASGLEDYYSIDIGPIHFVSLSTQYTDPSTIEFQEQATWLKNDLAQTTKPWKVAFFHKAPYSRGGHYSGEENGGAINKAFIPLFDQYHVDVVLNGHSHDYERFAPSKGVDVAFGGTGRTFPAGMPGALPNPLPDGNTATTYLVTGGAGSLTTNILGYSCLDAGCTACTGINFKCPAEVFDKDKASTVVYDDRHGYVVVKVEGDTMSFTVHTSTAGNLTPAQVIDTFTIKKSNFNISCGVMTTPDAGPLPPDATPGLPDASQSHPDAAPGQPDGGTIQPKADAAVHNLDAGAAGVCTCRAGGTYGRNFTGGAVASMLALWLVGRRRRRA